MRRVSWLASFLSLVAIGASAHATTIPVPKGVVSGKISYSETYGHYTIDTKIIFSNVKVVGRFRGSSVLASSPYISYKAHQDCWDSGCDPRVLRLGAPFHLTGSTAAGVPFDATCSAGGIGSALTDVDVVGVGIPLALVSASCSGGTLTVQSFAFRFVTLDPRLLQPSFNFAGALVDA